MLTRCFVSCIQSSEPPRQVDCSEKVTWQSPGLICHIFTFPKSITLIIHNRTKVNFTHNAHMVLESVLTLPHPQNRVKSESFTARVCFQFGSISAQILRRITAKSCPSDRLIVVQIWKIMTKVTLYSIKKTKMCRKQNLQFGWRQFSCFDRKQRKKICWNYV